MNIPINNKTALHDDIYHGWSSSPNTRSTTDVLWTCLATILLCVYTAVHLNIPEPGERKRWQAMRRAKWVTYAVFAPEIVLLSAWKQFNDARILRNRLRQRIRELSPADPEGGPEKTLVTADITELDDIPAEEDITWTYAFYAVMGGFRLKMTTGEWAGKSLALNIKAIDEMARLGFFWNIETTAIEDKSKQDTLAKLLTIMQVGWMIVQCSARKLSSLPLSILEIHTFIHAVCAAIMFGLWFKKPLDVRDATTKTVTPKIQSLVAELLERPEDSMESRLILRKVNFGRDRLNPIKFFDRFENVTTHDMGFDPVYLGATESDLMLWVTVGGFFLIQAVYGGFHMTAWHSYFPTTFEKWFWRGSCMVAAGGMTIAGVSFILCRNFINWTNAQIDDAKTYNRRLPWYLRLYKPFIDLDAVVLVLWLAIWLLAWVGARGFIVVESLISLRAVPIGVYDSVSWSNYIPHI